MKKIILASVISIFITGCASVKMEDSNTSNKAKQFAPPSAGNSGLYIYRDSGFGALLKKDIRVDGKCIGASAPGVFFYTEVSGDKTHEVTTQSEFSPNKLTHLFNAGKNYFIRQYIKMGVFIGGADLELVPEVTGKEDVKKLELAANGICES